MGATDQLEERDFSTFTRESLKVVFDELFKPLCAFAWKYLQETIDAEDLVQDAFVSLWQQRENFDNYLSVKSYLYTTTRNKCLNVIKHQKVMLKHEQSLVYELESERFFTDNVVEQEVFNQFYRQIESLPDASRKIMLLALQGAKNREIADALGISENTIKTQKKIAYEKIRTGMGPVMRGIMLAL